MAKITKQRKSRRKISNKKNSRRRLSRRRISQKRLSRKRIPRRKMMGGGIEEAKALALHYYPDRISINTMNYGELNDLCIRSIEESEAGKAGSVPEIVALEKENLRRWREIYRLLNEPALPSLPASSIYSDLNIHNCNNDRDCADSSLGGYCVNNRCQAERSGFDFMNQQSEPAGGFDLLGLYAPPPAPARAPEPARVPAPAPAPDDLLSLFVTGNNPALPPASEPLLPAPPPARAPEPLPEQLPGKKAVIRHNELESDGTSLHKIPLINTDNGGIIYLLGDNTPIEIYTNEQYNENVGGISIDMDGLTIVKVKDEYGNDIFGAVENRYILPTTELPGMAGMDSTDTPPEEGSTPQDSDLKFVIIPGLENTWGDQRYTLSERRMLNSRIAFSPAHWQKDIADLIGDTNILKSGRDYTGTSTPLHCGDRLNKPSSVVWKKRKIMEGGLEMRNCIQNIFETYPDVQKSVISTSQGAAVFIDYISDNLNMLKNIKSIVFISPATIFPNGKEAKEAFAKLIKFLDGCKEKNIGILLLINEIGWGHWDQNWRTCSKTDCITIIEKMVSSNGDLAIKIPKTTHAFDIQTPYSLEPLNHNLTQAIKNWCENPSLETVKEISKYGKRIMNYK